MPRRPDSIREGHPSAPTLSFTNPLLNRTYREFAEHYNVAVIPHAVRKPRGKNSVESSVGKIANRIRNMLRERTFFDFDELNEAIREKLADLNSRPFQKRAGSRDEKFEAAERAALQPLPARPFEVARRGSPVKVPKSYHVLHRQLLVVDGWLLKETKTESVDELFAVVDARTRARKSTVVCA